MTYKVILQPRAESDIAQVYLYIAERNPAAAARWYRRLRAEIESLSTMPARCTMAPESKKLQLPLRQLVYGKRSGIYRVVIRVVEETREVHVLAVRHGARQPLELEDLDL